MPAFLGGIAASGLSVVNTSCMVWVIKPNTLEMPAFLGGIAALKNLFLGNFGLL